MSTSQAINEGATVKDLIHFTFKPTVGVVIGAKVDNVPSKLIQMRGNHDALRP